MIFPVGRFTRGVASPFTLPEKAVPMNKSRIVLIVLGLTVVAVGGVAFFYYDEIAKLYKDLPDRGITKGSHEGLVYLDNGLTIDERATFYHLAEGSEIYPVLWL